MLEIKTPKSAVDKFREKGYKDADRMSDLVGLMAVTDDMSLVYQIRDYMVEKLPKEHTEEEDMIKNSKNRLSKLSYKFNNGWFL